MKHFKITAAAVIAATLIGCASTAPRERTEYPTLTVLNPTLYVWDDSKSVALNVANMALPAGVGKGMKDYATKEEATNGQSTAGERAFGNVVMGLSQGVFGLMSAMTQTSQVDKELAWNPAIVEYVSVSEVGSDLGPAEFVKLREIVGSRIKSALSASAPDLQWFGELTPKKTAFLSNTIYVFKSDVCDLAQQFQAFEQGKAPKFSPKLKPELYFEDLQNVPQHCSIEGKLSVAGLTEHNGEAKYIIVTELFGGFGLIDLLSRNHNGYFIVNNSFDVFRSDGLGKINRSYPFAFVQHKGKTLTFVKP